MTSISTQLHQSGYYQLGNTGSGTGNANNATRSAQAMPSLASTLGAAKPAGFSDAVLLDLSPEAQQYLSGLNAPKPEQPAAANDSFVLSAKQRLALSALLDKYKDAPYTQDTFDQIQDELHQAGLNPDQLSAVEKSRSFSTTAALVDALAGGKGLIPGSQPVSDEALKTKAANYMQYVVDQWKKISADGQAEHSADAVSAVGGAENG